MNASPEMQSAWTDYWKNGATESMPQDKSSGRLVALDLTWESFFSKFDPGAKLLDLATGGGDVVRQAIALRKNFELTGVDIADLSAVSASLPGVRLVGETDLSKLPFPDAAFDGISSQFGFEYADASAASREAIRVLVRGGRGCFVLHHADSAITHGDSSSLAAYRSVFAGSTAFQDGRKVFDLHQAAASHMIADAESRFRSAVLELQKRLRNDRAFGAAQNVVGFLSRLASEPKSLSPAEGLHRLDAVEKYNEGRNLRKVAQTSAALDAIGVQRVASLLEGAGAVVDMPKELKYTGGRTLAWCLSFHK